MPDLYWCQIVPPDRAAEVGTERFRWAPAPRTEQLRDGAVLLVTHHTMLTRDPAHAYWEGLEQEIVAHLGTPSGWTAR